MVLFEFLQKTFPIFRLTLAILYFIGFLLHVLDVMNLRLNFSEMDFILKIWILFLLIFDLLASIGLFLRKPWGEFLFISIATVQLVAYIGFSSFFGPQEFLIIFHLLCLAIYGIFKAPEIQRIFDGKR